MYMTTVQTVLPTLSIDLGSDQPVVQQIVSTLRQYLLRGDLAPGDQLPSSRALARDLGVHFNTVAQAYRELESEGWLALRRRAGTIVVERDQPKLSPKKARALRDEFVDAQRSLVARYEARGLDRSELLRLAMNSLKGDNDS